MRAENVPPLDVRYWLALLAASLFGTASGDFAADILDLGFLGGLLPCALLFAAVFVAERRAPRPTDAYYWAAIVITRTAATNIADYATHALRLGYIAVGGVLSALLLAALLTDPARRQTFSLVTDARYWVAVMVAGVLGTVGGDAISHTLGLPAAVLTAALPTAATLAWLIAARPIRKSGYWIALLTVRVMGTIGADFIASHRGLGLGLRWSMPITGLLLLATLMLPDRVRRIRPAA